MQDVLNIPMIFFIVELFQSLIFNKLILDIELVFIKFLI